MSDSIVIRPVVTKKELKQFILFPWKIYRGATNYPNWVPPLIVDEQTLFNPRKNPFFLHSEQKNFLAYRADKIVGRISGTVDQQYLEYGERDTAYFGFFECFDDEDVAAALFQKVQEWARAKNMKKILGPMNPTPNHILGLLIDAFDKPPVVQTPYNPPYYRRLYEKSDMQKEKDHYAYYLDQTVRPSDRMKRVAELAKKRGRITVRPVNMKNYDSELQIIHEIYNAAWKERSDFVPWTEEEFFHMAADLKLIVIPELIFLAFVDGDPAGFVVPIPDINQVLIKMNGRLLPFGLLRLLWGKSRVNKVRLALLGIKQKYQNKGIDAIFIYESYIQAERHGFKAAEMSLIIEDNYKLLNMLDSWGAERYKTYRIYQKSI